MAANPAAEGGQGVAAGLRVLELGSSVSLAVAGMVLADNAAEVIRIEPPGGDPLRARPAFRMWARGKQSELADLGDPAGRRRVRELAAEADVALLGLKPASVERFGLEYESLAESNPGLVYCALSGFGSRGPYRDLPVYDGVMAAKGGRMYEFSVLFGGERPAFAAAPVVAHGAAMLALQGVFAALRERERTGRGQRLETSLAQALSVYDMTHWLPGMTGELRHGDSPFVPYSIARTADGVWLQFAQNGPALFETFFRLIDLDPGLSYRESMGAGGTDPDKLRELRGRILERMAQKTWAEWQAVFEGERNIAVEPFWAPGEALDHPQFLHMGDSRELTDPEVGPTRQLGPLIDLKGSPAFQTSPAPAPGSLAGRGWSGEGRPTPGRGGEPAPQGILGGVTVLEFGMWIATPFSSTQLADLGARVIKIEPLEGDPMRHSGRLTALKMIQGKQSVAVDLKRDEGREIVHRLVGRADALVHGYRPGAPERLGIDYPTLREINPRLVYLYNGSYGSSGPRAWAAAFHVTGGAVCGGAHAQAGRAMPPPPDAELTPDEAARTAHYLERCNEANPDFNSAVAAAAALTLGLYVAERRGEGLAMETRMMLSNAYMMSADFIDYAGRPPREQPDAELLGLGPLYRLYPARDGWVFLAAPSQRDFERLCGALAREDLARDPRFREPQARGRNAGELAKQLAEILAAREADALERELTSRGVACVRADRGAYPQWLFEQEWARKLGYVVDVEESAFGPYRRYGAGVSCERPARPGGGYRAGEHTRKILAEIGYAPGAVEALLERGVVAEA